MDFDRYEEPLKLGSFLNRYIDKSLPISFKNVLVFEVDAINQLLKFLLGAQVFL